MKARRSRPAAVHPGQNAPYLRKSFSEVKSFLLEEIPAPELPGPAGG
jgi:hypothetical protein